MRTTISIMVAMTLLTISFNLFLGSNNKIDSPLFFAAVILALLSFLCWGDAINRAKQEDRNREQDRIRTQTLMRTLRDEVKGLRQDLRNRDRQNGKKGG